MKALHFTRFPPDLITLQKMSLQKKLTEKGLYSSYPQVGEKYPDTLLIHPCTLDASIPAGDGPEIKC
jgi:hypothetical protein